MVTKTHLWLRFSIFFRLSLRAQGLALQLRLALCTPGPRPRPGPRGRRCAEHGLHLRCRRGGAAAVAHLHNVCRRYGQLTQVTVPCSGRHHLLHGPLGDALRSRVLSQQEQFELQRGTWGRGQRAPSDKNPHKSLARLSGSSFGASRCTSRWSCFSHAKTSPALC